MAASVEAILIGMDHKLDQLSAEVQVLKAVLSTAIPYLSDTARLRVDAKLRDMMGLDRPQGGSSALVSAALGSGLLLPVAHPDWNGVPAAPE